MADAGRPKKRQIVVESDSDDDVPLSTLRQKVQIKKEGVQKKTSTSASSSSTPPSIKKEKPTAIKKEAPNKPIVDGSDSDDDVPIAVLMKRKQEALALAAAAKKPKIVITKKPKPTTPDVKKISKPASKPIVSHKKSSSSSTSNGRTSSFSSSGGTKKIVGDPGKSSQLCEKFYTTLDKGKLCQYLLRRWWYAISWPQEGVQDLCPKGYEALDGFPGVFVGTSTKFIGNIVDKRDQDTCPNLRNFSQKSSQELQDLCITAYEEQIRQLLEAEGANTKLERTLKRELQEVKNIRPEKADKQAAKLLKQPF